MFYLSQTTKLSQTPAHRRWYRKLLEEGTNMSASEITKLLSGPRELVFCTLHFLPCDVEPSRHGWKLVQPSAVTEGALLRPLHELMSVTPLRPPTQSASARADRVAERAVQLVTAAGGHVSAATLRQQEDLLERARDDHRAKQQCVFDCFFLGSGLMLTLFFFLIFICVCLVQSRK
jgi:hypothetical protein